MTYNIVFRTLIDASGLSRERDLYSGLSIYTGLYARRYIVCAVSWVQRVKPAGPGISRGREITVGLANFVLPGAQPGVFYINQNSLSPIPAPPFKDSAFDTGNKQCIA